MGFKSLGIAAAAAAFLFAPQVEAGTITFHSMQYSTDHFVPHFHFDGIVEDGDVEALDQIFNRFVSCQSECYRPEGYSSAVVTLNSPGGSYTTGLTLAKYFRDHAIATVVESDMRCYSACAFAFLGGTGASTQDGVGVYIDRVVEPGGVVGFHAPYFPDEALAEVVKKVGVEQVLGGSREMISLMVRQLVDWNVDPDVIATMVSMGPDETYDLATPNDLYLVRTALPDLSPTDLQPDPQAAVRNACLRLLAIRERLQPRDMIADLPSTFARDIGVDESGRSLSGIVISNKPLSLGACAVPTAQLDGNYDFDVSLYMSPGIDGSMKSMLSFFNRTNGWSNAGAGGAPSTRIFQKGSMSHFYLDPGMDLSDLAATRAVEWMSKRFITLAAPEMPTYAPELEVLVEAKGERISRLGDVWVFERTGGPNLFSAAKVALSGKYTDVSYESESSVALLRAGRYRNSANAFSWMAFTVDGASAVIDIEVLKQDGNAVSEDELALVRKIECSVKFQGHGLKC